MADETPKTPPAQETKNPDTPPVTEPTGPVVQPPIAEGIHTPEQTAVSSDATAVNVETDSVQAQVPGKPWPVQDKLAVHETHVHADRVITDTSDPLAVQVPPAGRGNAITPIGRAFGGTDGAKTVEDQFGN
jgi:hypothetical protein